MSELQVFHDGYDWVIAASAEDAAALLTESRGDDPPILAAEFTAMAPDAKLGVLCNERGKPDDHGIGVTKTCAEWVEQEGRGILCSRDY